MELKDFVKESLVQINEGVREAQEHVRSVGGYINPVAHGGSRGKGTDSHFAKTPDGLNTFLVSFDVAVVASEAQNTNAKASVKVASLLDLGAGGASSELKRSTSQISFKVPVALPVDEVSYKEYKNKESERAKEAMSMLELAKCMT